MITPDSPEPLRALSRFSWDWAPALCEADHGCGDYHRAWSLVRLVELGGALPAGAAFIEREAAALARAGRRRVLVSGGADTGVTALVVRAFRRHGVAPDIVFVDRCATPCRQNELFARAAGFELEAIQCDARDIAVAPVDAVIAHSFLQMLPGEARAAVLQAWVRSLAPGGVVWMSTYLAASEGELGRPKDAQKIATRRTALQAGVQSRGWTAAEAAEAADCAGRFWMRSMSQPPGITEAGLRGAFEAAGLAIRAIEEQEPEPSPVTLGAADRARRRVHIAAVRG